MAKSGASKGAKKVNAFNDGKLEGVNVAMIKKVGEPISMMEATRALHVIKQTSGGNPLMEELRRKRLFKSNPIDVNM